MSVKWLDAQSDFRLVSTKSIHDLDVVESGKGLKLRELTIFERMVRFARVFFGWIGEKEVARKTRFEKYFQLAYTQAPKVRFDNGIRTWKRPDLDVSNPEWTKLFSQWKERAPHIKATHAFYRALGKCENFKLANLTQSVKETLSPEVKEANEFLVEAQSVTEDYPYRQRLVSFGEWRVNYAEVSLARSLGIEFKEAGSGVNGALFGRGLDGKNRLVIKLNGEDGRPFFMTERIIGQRTQPQVCKHDPRQAGAVAYMADEFFGFGLIPRTFTNREGWSAQEFVPHTIPADKVLIRGQKLEEIPPEQLTGTIEVGGERVSLLEALQIKALLNFFLGDLDGKLDKTRFQINSDGYADKIYETDNDNVLPHEMLDPSRDGHTLTKTHQWKEHRWAKLPFKVTAGSKLHRILTKLLDQTQLGKFKNNVREEFSDFWTNERFLLLQDRIATIRYVVENQLPLSLLAEWYSPEAEISDQTREQIENPRYYAGNGFKIPVKEPPLPQIHPDAEALATELDQVE